MDYQPISHASEPFPWLGIALAGVVGGVALLFVGSCVALLFRDCDLLEDF
jgi:hypothetical protein